MTEGARYEISIDGTVRTHRDTREIAIEAANFLKARNPYSKVVIHDLRTSEMNGDGRSKAHHVIGSGALDEVRSWSKTGKYLLDLSITAFDPTRT